MTWWRVGPEGREKQKRKRIKAYFDNKNMHGAYYALGATVFFALAAALTRYAEPDTTFEMYLWVSDAIAAVICAAMFTLGEHSASDQQIDAWQKEEFAKLIAAVPQKADIDREALLSKDKPIVLCGFARLEKLHVVHGQGKPAQTQTWNFATRIGRDGKTRWTPPFLGVLHYTAQQLFIFQCDVDLRTGAVLSQSIEEVFWKDVISVQVDTEARPWNALEQDLLRQWSKHQKPELRNKIQTILHDPAKAATFVRRTTLRIRTTDGIGLELVTADEAFFSSGNVSPIPSANDRALNRFREVWRGYKVAV